MDEEDEIERVPMEVGKETRDENTTVVGENEEEMGVTPEITPEQIQMVSGSQNDSGTKEEKIMRKLIQEWKNLDERFIPETQKQLYKDTFQKYKEKRSRAGEEITGQIGEYESNNIGLEGTSKGGRKRGR